MKKTIALLTLTLALIITLAASLTDIRVFSADETSTAKVYVTIAKGSLVVTLKEITVADADGDGALTVNDALYLAHESAYEGGADAGYAYEKTEYGISLTKLWGVENGGGYGYYVNNAMAMNLAETVGDGDYVSAFVYADTETFSDVYCYFDVGFISASAGEEIPLTLYAAGLDENWAPVQLTVENAVITVDGNATEYKTDAEGRTLITLDKAGSYLIGAFAEDQNLVPPVCFVTVSEAAPQTSDNSEAEYMLYLILGILTFATAIYMSRFKNVHEK